MEKAEIGFYIDGKRRYLVLGERIAIEPKKRILKIGKFYAIECKGSLAKELEAKLEEESKEICGGGKEKLLEIGEEIYQSLSSNSYDRPIKNPNFLSIIGNLWLIGYGSYLDYVAFFSPSTPSADAISKALYGICGLGCLTIGIGWLFSSLAYRTKAENTKRMIEDLLKSKIRYKKIISYNPNSLELIVKY